MKILCLHGWNSVVGGVNGLLGVAGLQFFRATNRVSVVLLTCALLALARWLSDRLQLASLWRAGLVGGVSTTVSDDSIDFWGSTIPTRDTFLSMSYGGGLKVLRKWGPLGYHIDVRGRTLPNYNGFAYSWLETTGGLTFSWGDR